MNLSHFTKCRQHCWSTLGLEVSRDERKLLAAGVVIAGWHLDLTKDSHRTNPACLQCVTTDGALGCPTACKEHVSSILEPRCLRLLDPVKIVRAELLPAMKYFNVV